MLPSELVFYIVDCINDKDTLLQMRCVNSIMRRYLKRIEWKKDKKYSIDFKRDKITFLANNKLYREVFFRNGYYKYIQYDNYSKIDYTITCNNFKIIRHNYNHQSVKTITYDIINDERKESIHYYALCTIS